MVRAISSLLMLASGMASAQEQRVRSLPRAELVVTPDEASLTRATSVRFIDELPWGLRGADDLTVLGLAPNARDAVDRAASARTGAIVSFVAGLFAFAIGTSFSFVIAGMPSRDITVGGALAPVAVGAGVLAALGIVAPSSSRPRPERSKRPS